MRMPNPGDVEAAFVPYLEPDESLEHWAYGRSGPPLVVFLPLYFLGVLPGVLARALLTTSYLVGLTERRLVVLRFRGYLKVEESFAYALEAMPPVRSKRTFFAATLAIDDADRPLTVRFGLFTAHNADRHVRGLLTRLERGPATPPPVKPEDALSDRFKALRRDLVDALGDDVAADFVDRAYYGPRKDQPHVVFGDAAPQGSYLEAGLVKNTIFAHVFDLEQPCWFVLSERLYEGGYSVYGPLPPEAPSIWDEPGLVPPALKTDTEYRDVENVDPYTLNGEVYRQWIFWVKPEEIGIDTLHQATARMRHRSESESGPRLRGDLFCLQPGLPLVYLATPYEGACVLLSQYAGLLRLCERSVKDGVAAPAQRHDAETLRQRAIQNVQALKRENEPRIHDPFWTSPTGYNYARWGDKGFRVALDLLKNTRPEENEAGQDYLNRVAAQVRAERDAWRLDTTDEDGACSGALDEALSAIYKALPKT
jgi:hypothetical protein